MSVSAIDVAQSLSGIDFPASKQDLINHANQQNPSRELQDVLSQMPERNYKSMADVEQAFGEIQ